MTPNPTITLDECMHIKKLEINLILKKYLDDEDTRVGTHGNGKKRHPGSS